MSTEGKPQRTVIERDYPAPIEDVWEMWTTKEGIESWWGPEGFTVTVQQLDLRQNGELLYTMTATAAPQVEFMKRAGMPLSNASRITFAEVAPPRRLVYAHLVDFVPGVAHYSVETQLELTATAQGTHLRLTLDHMHDQTWTQRAIMGWESELEKLRKRLAG